MVDTAIKNAFSKVKEEIKSLEAKFEVINKKLDQILNGREPKTKINENTVNTAQIPLNPQSSSGNEGVQSINHSSITHQSLINQSHNQQIIKVEDRFNALTNQELKVFLTIYNLEEQLGRGITYEDLSAKISLSTSCIRSYISSMNKKGIPIQKLRLNNKLTLFKINPHFRELNLKNRITNIYLGQDPSQKTLI